MKLYLFILLAIIAVLQTQSLFTPGSEVIMNPQNITLQDSYSLKKDNISVDQDIQGWYQGTVSDILVKCEPNCEKDVNIRQTVYKNKNLKSANNIIDVITGNSGWANYLLIYALQEQDGQYNIILFNEEQTDYSIVGSFKTEHKPLYLVERSSILGTQYFLIICEDGYVAKYYMEIFSGIKAFTKLENINSIIERDQYMFTGYDSDYFFINSHNEDGYSSLNLYDMGNNNQLIQVYDQESLGLVGIEGFFISAFEKYDYENVIYIANRGIKQNQEGNENNTDIIAVYISDSYKVLKTLPLNFYNKVVSKQQFISEKTEILGIYITFVDYNDNKSLMVLTSDTSIYQFQIPSQKIQDYYLCTVYANYGNRVPQAQIEFEWNNRNVAFSVIFGDMLVTYEVQARGDQYEQPLVYYPSGAIQIDISQKESAQFVFINTSENTPIIALNNQDQELVNYSYTGYVVQFEAQNIEKYGESGMNVSFEFTNNIDFDSSKNQFPSLQTQIIYSGNQREIFE